MRILMRTLPVVLLAAVAGCNPDYSPNTYASNAVQQANKVESAVVVGYRQVKISASGTVGAVSGGAAGGLLGAQAEPTGIVSALGTIGGTVVGGIVGNTVEHVAGDTTGWEYIVRKADGDMLSVTQREETPIPLGQKVLVITGNQARIVPDYSVAADPPAATGKEKASGNKDENKQKADEKAAPATAPSPPVAAATPAPAPANDAERNDGNAERGAHASSAGRSIAAGRAFSRQTISTCGHAARSRRPAGRRFAATCRDSQPSYSESAASLSLRRIGIARRRLGLSPDVMSRA